MLGFLFLTSLFPPSKQKEDIEIEARFQIKASLMSSLFLVLSTTLTPASLSVTIPGEVI